MKSLAISLVVLLTLCLSDSVLAQDWEVPQNPVLNSTAAYKSYESDILACAAWLAKTPIDSAIEKRKSAYKFFFVWLVGAPNVSIQFTPSVINKTVDPPDIMFMLMLGWTEYVLTHPEANKDQVKGNTAGLTYIIKYYKTGRGFKKSDWLEEISKAYEDGKLESWVSERLE